MKASGSTASLVQGVSQQVPSERAPGQHTEVVNMLPDPVTGLTRRHGTIMQAERQLPNPVAEYNSMVTDTDSWITYEFTYLLKNYTLLYRTAARPVGSNLPLFLVYNRTDKVFLDYVRAGTDPTLDLLESGGISSLTSVGKYVFMAGNTVIPTATTTEVYTDPTWNAVSSLWVRGGAYNRKFEIKVTRTGGVTTSFSYTTMASGYPGLLDTSDVSPIATDPAGGTENTKEVAVVKNGQYKLYYGAFTPTALSATKAGVSLAVVNSTTPASGQIGWPTGSATTYYPAAYEGAIDIELQYTHLKTVTNPTYARTVQLRTEAYNSAVTKWIADAAVDQTPANIAAKLKLAAEAAGMTGITIMNSTLVFTDVIGITVNDGGDNTLLRAVAQEVSSVDRLTPYHKIGKVVKVKTSESADPFYMRADPVDSQQSIVGYPVAEVKWVEAAATKYQITGGLLLASIVGTSFYIGSSKTILDSLMGVTTTPTFVASTVGDKDTSPLPNFVGRTITYLGMFQDRLLVGCEGILTASRVGDYLNFFRRSLLTVLPDDSLEIVSEGSSNDTLRYSVLYDRDIVIFGDNQQYVISGRTALTPTSANMPVMSSHKDANFAPPLAVGGVIFYGKVGQNSSSANQIQPGLNVESPESYLMSSQIDTYLPGQVIELSNHSKPTHLFLRTTGARNNLFVYTYLDKEGSGRVQDAWHRWEFDEDIGVIIGMRQTAEGLLIFYLRKIMDAGGTVRIWVVADLAPMVAELSKYPYLDSQRPASATGALLPSTPDLYVAFDNTSDYYMIGDEWANKDTLYAEFPDGTNPRMGYGFESQFTPTNPYAKDRNDKAILTGRLVVTKLLLALAKTAGIIVDITARRTTNTLEYNARIVGSPANVVGEEAIETYTQSVPIGHANEEYVVTIKSRRWLPMTITNMDWVGQFFNRVQRM